MSKTTPEKGGWERLASVGLLLWFLGAGAYLVYRGYGLLLG